MSGDLQSALEEAQEKVGEESKERGGDSTSENE
jgi:hypothetical protein